MNLPEKIVALSSALTEQRVAHAFGGAIALAYCVGEPRGTIDIDVNLFVPATNAASTLPALPAGVQHDAATAELIERDGQARLWWDQTPVDVFFNTTPFHEDAARRARTETFGPATIPVLACRDLAVFKAFFDRSKDWVDLESMADAGALDEAAVAGILVTYLGPDDHRLARLLAVAEQAKGS